ncbi:MAG: hypothetical protein A07HR60_01309 [uncultured archaeon A07HR60]|nr:MAG: hypothetical protein A07HR60_01309 [uncultured archaeon A07HR60]
MCILRDLLSLDNDREERALRSWYHYLETVLKECGNYSLGPVLCPTVHHPIVALESHRDLAVLN